jgi:hypothetical protein
MDPQFVFAHSHPAPSPLTWLPVQEAAAYAAGGGHGHQHLHEVVNTSGAGTLTEPAIGRSTIILFIQSQIRRDYGEARAGQLKEYKFSA